MAELNRRILALKIFTIVFGAVILGAGLDSHFNSSWVRSIHLPDGRIFFNLHQRVCTQPIYPCPSIAMEHYFISAVIIFLGLSLVGLATSYLFKLDYSSGQWNAFDFAFHVVGALALLAAGIVYRISAHQIHALVGNDAGFASNDSIDWKRTEKLVTGGLTILQAFAYACVAGLIGRDYA